MVLLTMLHLCNGATNIKNNILVPSVSFSSPNGGTVLVPPFNWWNSVSSTITNGAITSSK
jgi:hypothetical protein